jgi:hypothetical protein
MKATALCPAAIPLAIVQGTVVVKDDAQVDVLARTTVGPPDAPANTCVFGKTTVLGKVSIPCPKADAHKRSNGSKYFN